MGHNLVCKIVDDALLALTDADSFFPGLQGIVHPPSNDENTERIGFEPEQRPGKLVPKRSIHGKLDVHSKPAGTNKDT